MKFSKKVALSSLLGVASIGTLLGINHFTKDTDTAQAKNTQLMRSDVEKGEDYWGKRANKKAEWESKSNSKLVYEIYSMSGETRFQKPNSKNMYLRVAGFSAIGGFATHYYNNQTSFIVLQDNDNKSINKVYYLDRKGNPKNPKPSAKKGWVSSTYSIYIAGYDYNRKKCVKNFKTIGQTSRVVDYYDKLSLAPQTCNRIYNGTGFRTNIKMNTLFKKQEAKQYNMFLVTQVRANNNRSNEDYQKTTWSEAYVPIAKKAYYKNGNVYGLVTLESDIERVTYDVISQRVMRLRYTTSSAGVPSSNCWYAWNCNKEPRYFTYYGNKYGYSSEVKPYITQKKNAVVKPKRSGYGYSSSFYGIKNSYNNGSLIYTQSTYLDVRGEQAKIRFKPEKIVENVVVETRYALASNKSNPFKVETKKAVTFKPNYKYVSHIANPTMVNPKTGKTVRRVTSAKQLSKSYAKYSQVPNNGKIIFTFLYDDLNNDYETEFELKGNAKLAMWKSSPTSPTTHNIYSNLVFDYSSSQTPLYMFGAKRLYSIGGNVRDEYELIEGKSGLSVNTSNGGQFGINEASHKYLNKESKALKTEMMNAPNASISGYGNPKFYFRYELAYLNRTINKRIPPYTYTSCSGSGKDRTCTTYDDYNYRDKTFSELYGESGYNPNSKRTDSMYVYDEKSKSNVPISIRYKSVTFGYDNQKYQKVLNAGNDVDLLNAIVAKNYNTEKGEQEIYREYIEFPSRTDKTLITQQGLPILDEPIRYFTNNEPFTTPNGKIHETMYGSSNTIQPYANADMKNTMTYDVPDVDKNLRNKLKSPRKTEDGLTQYNLPLNYDSVKTVNGGKIGETIDKQHNLIPIITKDTYVVSKNTGFLSIIDSTVKPTDTGAIKQATSTQYTSATGQTYKDEPIIKVLQGKFGDYHKMYQMPIEAESIVRKKTYEESELPPNGETDVDDEIESGGDGFYENETEVEEYEARPYPIDNEATKKLYADKEKRQIMLPNETYTNYGSIGQIGLNELTFTFYQNYQFERFLAGSVQDDTWVAEQLEPEVKVGSGYKDINDEIKNNKSDYTSIIITPQQGKDIYKTANQRSAKLFGIRSTDGITYYDKLKSKLNLKE